MACRDARTQRRHTSLSASTCKQYASAYLQPRRNVSERMQARVHIDVVVVDRELGVVQLPEALNQTALVFEIVLRLTTLQAGEV